MSSGYRLSQPLPRCINASHCLNLRATSPHKNSSKVMTRVQMRLSRPKRINLILQSSRMSHPMKLFPTMLPEKILLKHQPRITLISKVSQISYLKAGSYLLLLLRIPYLFLWMATYEDFDGYLHLLVFAWYCVCTFSSLFPPSTFTHSNFSRFYGINLNQNVVLQQIGFDGSTGTPWTRLFKVSTGGIIITALGFVPGKKFCISSAGCVHKSLFSF